MEEGIFIISSFIYFDIVVKIKHRNYIFFDKK